MRGRPPRSTGMDTLFPYPTLFRSRRSYRRRGPARGGAPRLPRCRRLRRPVHRQYDGDGADLPWPVAAGSQRHPGDACRQACRGKGLRRVGDAAAAKGGPTPRDLLSAVALHNAARAVSATAGSTNAALHLLAIAHEAGVPFDLEEFEAAATSTPVIADLKPGGR